MSGIVNVLVIIVTADLYIFVFYHFAPYVQPRIKYTWVDKERGLVLLQLELENMSKVSLPVEHILLQILEYQYSALVHLTEFVPFKKELVQQDISPESWQDPIRLFGKTLRLLPGELIRGERLHTCSEDSILHVGLQVRLKLNWFYKRLSRLEKHAQWTTTAIVIPPK